jgi:hypothetical protein
MKSEVKNQEQSVGRRAGRKSSMAIVADIIGNARAKRATRKPLYLDPPRVGTPQSGQISIPQKRLSICQTQKLLLAAVRLWELDNGYRR